MIRAASILALALSLLMGACSWRDIGQLFYNTGKAYTDSENGGGKTGHSQPD